MQEHIRVGREYPQIDTQHDLLVRARRPGVRGRLRDRRRRPRSSTSCSACARPRPRAYTKRDTPTLHLHRAVGRAGAERARRRAAVARRPSAPIDPTDLAPTSTRSATSRSSAPARSACRPRSGPGCARPALADHRLAARARRPAHDAVPGEVDLRRPRAPADPGQGPRRRCCATDARAVRRARAPRDDGRARSPGSERRPRRRCTPTAGDLRSRTVIVAGGHGAFEPKKLPGYRPDPVGGPRRRTTSSPRRRVRGQARRHHRRRRQRLRLGRQPPRHRRARHARPPPRGLPRPRGDGQARSWTPTPRAASTSTCPTRSRTSQGNGAIEARRLFHSDDEGREVEVECDALLLQLGFKTAAGAAEGLGLRAQQGRDRGRPR